jgi:hypothetical protein
MVKMGCVDYSTFFRVCELLLRASLVEKELGMDGGQTVAW